MPFVSTRQLQTCFGKQLTGEKGWDCEEWLAKTDKNKCLPVKKGGSRCIRVGEPIISPVHTGPKGGMYFYVGNVKVYVPKGAEKRAIKRYGITRSK